VLDSAQKKILMEVGFEMAEYLTEAFEQIPLEEPMFIQLNLATGAQGHLVWDASSRSPARICRHGVKPEGTYFIVSCVQILHFHCSVISADATTLGGSFLGFVPKQSADTVLVHEDGFLAMLKTDHWKLLRHCLSSGMTCGIRSDNPDGTISA
jgi:hypothetical protein